MTKIGMVANLIMNKYGERNDLDRLWGGGRFRGFRIYDKGNEATNGGVDKVKIKSFKGYDKRSKV